MSIIRRSVALTLAATVLSGLLMWARPAPACIGDEFNSVHFHSGQVDFGRIPRRARVWEADDRHVDDHMSGGSRIGVELEEKAERDGDREANRVRMLIRADKALLKGDWRGALALFRGALVRFGQDGVVRDRVEILEQLLRTRAKPKTIRSILQNYTSAVPVTGAELRQPGKAENLLAGIASDSSASALREHALYQWACLAYDAGKNRRAVELYQRQLAQYPRSTKSEAGLIMLARAAVLSPKLAEQDLAAGSQAMERLLRQYPKTRYRHAVLGLRARVQFLRERFPEALASYFALGDMYSVEIVRKKMGHPPANSLARLMAGYLRNLARANTIETYSNALVDLERTRKSFGPADARLFSDMLQQDLSLPAPYFYYRLYHTEITPREIVRLGMLARRLVHLHPRAKLPPLVIVRFAEVDYFRKKYGLARQWADEAAIADRGRTEATPRALYVRGACLGKLQRTHDGIADFERLLRVYPSSPLRRAAREELAILYEAAGNLGRALDQYIALGYDADVAFFLDGRMSTKEVEEYLRTRPDRLYRYVTFDRWYESSGDTPRSPLHTHELLRYTLGVRYMRGEQWDRAARMLRQLPRKRYVEFSRGRVKWESKPSPDPLSAIRQLSRLKRATARAHNGADRAEAAYRYASYYYSHGTLLLYVPPLWQGGREIHFQMYWNKNHATPKDELFVRHYMREHEVYAHALDIYEGIARRYPHSPYAPKALYRAACSAYHQSNLNEWWRDHEVKFGLLRRASKLMATLAKRYPKHPLAKEATKYARVFAGTWPRFE